MNFLVVIIFCLIHGGNEVVADDDGVKDITAPEDLMPKKEVDEFNQIRKDLLKSFVDFRSQIESTHTEGNKKSVDSCILEVKKLLKLDSYDITNEEELKDTVDDLSITLELIFDLSLTKVFPMDNESDQKKYEDFFKQISPEYKKRFEPFKKYERGEKKD